MPELRVIDEQGKNVGVFSLEKALEIAKEKGLDLIEISATAKPPIAKIISFDKFRYQKEKELKKQRAGQKSQTLKQVRISGRAALNDLKVKARKVNEFLKIGHAVEIQLVLRGREKGNRNWAREKFEIFIKELVDPVHHVISPIRASGRGFTITIAQSSNDKEKHQKENKDNENGENDSATDGN